MSDDESQAAEARSAGALLRAARERQGLHIAALAAAIKVPPAKLDALEHGRYGELTDTTFVRALAQSVCRVLKIDARPVLDLLPSAGGAPLAKAEKSLHAPFRERPGRAEPSDDKVWHQPVFWIVLLLLLAAGGFVWWPNRPAWLPAFPAPGKAAPVAAESQPAVPSKPTPAIEAPPRTEAATPAPAPPAAEAAASGAAVMTETVHSAPPPATPDAAQAVPAGLAVVRASEPSWVEVSDARGSVLLSRTLQPGESVGLDGPLPMRVTIGNGPATELVLRGKRVPLAAAGRDNVVRMELR